jgi:hypothetical protein
MTHHSILYKCKLCGREGVAKADVSCPPDQIDIFAKALCCDICFDAREKRMKSEKQIFEACHFLNPIIMDNFRPQHAEKMRTNCRAALEIAVPAFCESVCAQYRLQSVFVPSFVDDFYTHPDKAGKIMAEYKYRIQALAEQPPDQEP